MKTMKTRLAVFVLFIFAFNLYGQDFEIGTIITKRYDTITKVKIEKVSDSKSLLHLTYINEIGETESPNIESIKCYTRGEEKFVRIYYDCEMILVKVVAQGDRVNLYEKNKNGVSTYFIEKVYDELIKVPSSSGKFSKIMSAFLVDSSDISKEIKAKKLTDIKEIVNLYNKG